MNGARPDPSKGGRMTQGSAGVTTSRLVTLQPHGDRPPLFVFPGVHGDPETFKDLASRLGTQRPVLGFRHIGAQRECEPVRQVSRLAQLYAAELRGAQPRGPYYLFGYSFGGVVAFEVARELIAQGQRVGLVVMADCPAPGYPKPPPVWERVRTHAQNLLEGTPAERVRYLRDRVENTVTRISKLLGFVPYVDEEPQDQEKAPEHIKHVDAALYEAYNHYQPMPQCVDVLFLSADTPPDWPTARFDDPLMGWASALRGRISQCSVPGAHLSIFAPENVPVLVERIQTALRSAERAASWTPGPAAASSVKAS
mgnify:CR=1 FL=1